MADQPPADNCVADLTPLGGLRVVDLSTTRAGAFVTQFLADAGADVVLVESPAGHPLRSEPAWPALARGKRSVSADIHIDADRDLVAGLVSEADVVISTFGSAEADDLGLGAAELAARNPRLVSVSITGWGPSGPWCDLPDHEGLVMAKTGMFHAKRRITTRPGPSYISVPFASWGAAQAALHGLLAALLEREGSGQGQHVEADLVRGAGLFDTWSWFTELVGIRWPEAYEVVDAYTPDGEPTAPLVYPLLVAPTSDGHWLQFAQVQPRLFAAMIAEFGLTSVLADPRWAGFPVLDRQELRTEMWELMIETVRQRTLAEWIQVFETSPDLNAEIFRSGPGSLDHPQLKHDGRVATVDDPLLGPVRQPSTLVHSDERPLRRLQPAPRLDGDGPAVRATTETGARSGVVAPDHDAPSGDPPLAGITVIELGVMFAAPFGSTLLADLGARVIKVESLEGDGIRHILSFPELGGARVMQGKESIALDLDTPEGRRLVHELAGQADIVLQGFRAGAAARAGVDADTLRAENPALIYVNAPGYGTSGPFGTRPAYAPSIGAAAGLALADAPDAAGATSTMAEIKAAAIRLSGASAVPSLQADGIAALGVATAMLLGLVGRARSRPLGALTVTMLATTTHAMIDSCVDYRQRPTTPTVDVDGYGLHALYRMYPTAAGWVFLAAPSDAEWALLLASLGGQAPDLAAAHFADAASRHDHDVALVASLTAVFAQEEATVWEKRFLAAGVGCVVVHEDTPERQLQVDAELSAEYAATAISPVFDEHLRTSPAVRFSRSATRAPGGCLVGQHTDAVLAWLGHDEAAIADLRARRIVG